jgi:D-alanine-D-alanine ligase
MQERRIRVAVVYGGRNSEHSISVVSAGAVIAALDPARYEVIPIGITREGEWVLTSAEPKAFEISGRTLPTVDADAVGNAAVVLPADSSGSRVVPLGDAGTITGFDVAFPVLHGRFGEDGTIQGLFELAGVPYVGAGVFASAAAMDKEFAKKLFAASGLAVGAYVVVRGDDKVSRDDLEHLGLPLFVKPARAGSSVGISKVREWDQLPEALELARAHDNKVLIEAAVVGREIEIGVLESRDAGGRPSASVPAEIRLVGDHDWYDFEAKYLDDACEFDVPAHLDADTTERVQAAAIAAFEAIDCAGLARVDFFLRPDGELIVNEVNTMPGFTPISMFPRVWAATGITYPDLVDRLVQTALRRAAR